MDTPLAKIRKVRSFSKAEVARQVGIDKSHYGNIEAGKAQASAAVAERIAKLFGHEITEIQILYPGRYVDSEAA